jgi:hypothetical protein
MQLSEFKRADMSTISKRDLLASLLSRRSSLSEDPPTAPAGQPEISININNVVLYLGDAGDKLRPKRPRARKFTVAAALLAALFHLPALALAASPAEREARSYLPNCETIKALGGQHCAEDTDRFVKSYVAAKSGNMDEMRNVSDMFFAGLDRTLPRDIINSCAWLMVSFNYFPGIAYDRELVYARCEALLPRSEQRASAVARAEDLLAHIPRPKPSTPVKSWDNLPARCLDSTVVAFGATNQARPFVPPPGCPNRPKNLPESP